MGDGEEKSLTESERGEKVQVAAGDVKEMHAGMAGMEKARDGGMKRKDGGKGGRKETVSSGFPLKPTVAEWL